MRCASRQHKVAQCNNEHCTCLTQRLAWSTRTLYDSVSRSEDQLGSTPSCTITGMQLQGGHENERMKGEM